MARQPRIAPRSGSPEYRQIWRIVDGALRQAFHDHPDYIARGKRADHVRTSLTKRVAGALNSYAEQSAQVRSGSSPAHETACGAKFPAGQGEVFHR